ncbi:MAG TPA: HAMP domain-containing sensor histidine kinase [Paludibacteraceae bacterium]|nr:HAMP domain-containing sensor histidine kinase [Paludibacteraceae bacterium]HPT43089.1 HAMP domain-containing sensor histidine kinase [Paludibacteraceae bacterium]
MNKVYQTNQIMKIIFVVGAMLIVLASTIFTNRLAGKLSIEEQKKIEIWAEATRQLILADETTDMNFILNIIEGNTTIPVIITDNNDQMIDYRNIKAPEKNNEEFFRKKIATLKNRKNRFEINLKESNTKQYIYYDDSLLLKQLYIFPYIQFGVIFVFFIIVILAFSSSKRAEQNKVWVGLSKETAHQLGTPISSLLAWTELLKIRYEDDKLITDMEKDVNRLKVIADRFSKIGSKPDLKKSDLKETLSNAVNYMNNRSSNKVEISLNFNEGIPSIIPLNVPLFEWVIENLCKNAIDAMNGIGKIALNVKNTENDIIIDITDNGKGIERNMYKAIFSPGFTTKERGWGLGLSLAKRIIEEYHKGKIFVKHSEINVGTTFRIILPVN